MASKFGGVPVKASGSRFGGQRVQTEPEADFSGVSSRVIPQPPRTLSQDVGRELGLGGRSVIQGLYNVAGLAFDPLAYAYQSVTGRPQASSSQRGEKLADVLGLPRPETTSERIGGDVTSALTGVGGGIGAARQLAQRAPGFASQIGQALSARPGAQVAGATLGPAASGVTREAGGGPVAQTAAGLAGALAPSARPVAAAGLSGALAGTVPQARKELAREAARQGIRLTPTQLSDSRFLKFAESALRSIPFTGAQGRFQQQVGSYNRALARTIGEDAENLAPEVFARAKARQSAKFDELTARNALRVDDSLIKRLNSIAEESKVAGKDIQGQVESAIDALYAQSTTGPGGIVIPGQAYQAFDSQLGNIIRSGGTPSHFLGRVQSTVRGAMDRSISPQDAQAWRQLRTEYGTRKALTPLAAKSVEGEIRPAQVMGAATSTRAGKEAMATGRSQLGNLSRIGQMMKEPPSSGTAERATVSGLLGGAAYIDPVTGSLTAGALNLLSRGLDSRRLAQLMIRENPGLNMETALEVIRRSAIPSAIVNQQQER